MPRNSPRAAWFALKTEAMARLRWTNHLSAQSWTQKHGTCKMMIFQHEFFTCLQKFAPKYPVDIFYTTQACKVYVFPWSLLCFRHPCVTSSTRPLLKIQYLLGVANDGISWMVKKRTSMIIKLRKDSTNTQMKEHMQHFFQWYEWSTKITQRLILYYTPN